MHIGNKYKLQLLKLSQQYIKFKIFKLIVYLKWDIPLGVTFISCESERKPAVSVLASELTLSDYNERKS